MGPRETMNVCSGCGGRFADAPGGTVHRYMESSPGCWAAYGEVLAREYEQPAFFQAHQFTVDAYAVQHPGRPSPQSIQSVAVHLIRLCLTLEHGASVEAATAVMHSATQRKDAFHWLEPPPSQGGVTAANVHRAASPQERAVQVRAWAEVAWAAWAAHHDTVRGWIDACRESHLPNKRA